MPDNERPPVHFFGRVYDRKSNPTDERKVLSLDKSEKREDGTWRNIKAVAIQYEDGTVQQLGEHLTMKFFQGKGNLIANCYWTERKPQQETNASDFDDSIPF